MACRTGSLREAVRRCRSPRKPRQRRGRASRRAPPISADFGSPGSRAAPPPPARTAARTTWRGGSPRAPPPNALRGGSHQKVRKAGGERDQRRAPATKKPRQRAPRARRTVTPPPAAKRGHERASHHGVHEEGADAGHQLHDRVTRIALAHETQARVPRDQREQDAARHRRSDEELAEHEGRC